MPVTDSIPRELRLLPGVLPDGRIWILKLLAISGLTASDQEARHHLAQGAVFLDGHPIQDPEAKVLLNPGAILQVGAARVRLA